jgi:predicted N-acetyltransferase YhbS
MAGAVQWRVLGPDERALQPAFVDLVRAVFRAADFARWIDWGLWQDDYRVVLALEDGRAVASVGVQRMRLQLPSGEREVYQWGAVAVHPACRGRGLATEAIRRADALCAGAPVLLYGNPSVRAFYPRFGFRAAPSWRFRLNRSLHPQAGAPLLDPATDADLRRRLLAAVEGAALLDPCLAARGHGRILLWYYANGFARPLHRIDASTWIVAAVEDGVLQVDEVIAPQPVDLLPILPRLLTEPVTAVEFGWAAQAWLDPDSAAALQAVEEEADLFLRGCDDWPAWPAALQPLART